MKESIYIMYLDSPIGMLEITTDNKSIRSILFVDEENMKKPTKIKPMIMLKACRQLREYFYGIRKEFDLRIYLEGTEFQKKVWKRLINIPYGEIATYKEIAESLGNPKASRAVGNANNKNKILIIIPCHRVIGSDGSLNGFIGGVGKKEWLLNHENMCL